MFAARRHNPYTMRYKYSAEELVIKVEQTQAQFTASEAIIEQIKLNWQKYEEKEEMDEQENNWFENIINDIQNRVESRAEARQLFRVHSDKFYQKFRAIQDARHVVMANLAIQKCAEPGTRQCAYNLSQSWQHSSNDKSIESLSEQSAKGVKGVDQNRRYGNTLALPTAEATSLTDFQG